MMFSTVRLFRRSRKGNFAAITALLSVPLMACAAMTVEYSNLSDHQARLQHAVDAAALFVGKRELENGVVPSDDDVYSFVLENFDGDIGSVTVKGVETAFAGYTVMATSTAPDYFFGRVLPQVFNQSAEATVPKASPVNVAIAFVFDTSGSMLSRVDSSDPDSTNRIGALKASAKSFIDKLSDQPDHLFNAKVAIVPFNSYVNVGLSSQGKYWLQNGVYEYTRTLTPDPDDENLPYKIVFRVDYFRYWWQNYEVIYHPGGSDDWVGCVGSRQNPYTFRDTAPNDPFPKIIDLSCPPEITSATDDWDTLRTKIDALTAGGLTYAAPGVMWGLRVLSDQEPFAEVADLDDPLRIMIMMADGDNFMSHSLADGHPLHQEQWRVGTLPNISNENTATACREARDEDVVIYSIAFGASISDTGKAILQACASDPDSHYFEAVDSDGLQDIFDSIADEMIRLRLTG